MRDIASFQIGARTNGHPRVEAPNRFELPPRPPYRGPCCRAALSVGVLAQAIFYLVAEILHQLVTEPQLSIAAATSLNTATGSSLPV